MQTSFDIIELSKIISAAAIVLGLIIGIYKIYDRITDKQDAHDREIKAMKTDHDKDMEEMRKEHEKQIAEMKAENQSLKEENQSEIRKINKEETIMCYALLACLDGLEQLGANHTVPEAKKMLEKHLNKAAHDEE